MTEKMRANPREMGFGLKLQGIQNN